MKIKRYLVILTLSLILIMSMMAFSVYLYDPLLYYRIPEDRLIVNNYRFINPGITKNAVYDTVMIGSSMIQNFDMDQFRDELELNPIKLSVGAMSIEGMKLTYDQVVREDKANHVYIAIDIHALTYAEDDLATYAAYLYDDNSFNDIKYLLGYETWLRLLPINVGLSAIDFVGYNIPNTYATHSIDQIGYWADTATFGEDIVKDDYLKHMYEFDLPIDDLDVRLMDNANRFLDIFGHFDLDHYTFFFPPYSALYWHMIDAEQAMDEFLTIKSYLAEQLSHYENVDVYDFQDITEITNLNLYKDPTHYHPDLNELMVTSFKDGSHKIQDPDLLMNATLVQMIRDYQEQNADWLNE
jgi:hypothetical protein